VLHRLSLRLLTLGVAAAMAVVGPASASTAHAAGDPSGTTDQALAKQALAQAKALFHPTAASPLTAREGVASPAAQVSRDATLVLRDLAMRADDLPTASQQTSARTILARPTSGAYDPNVGEPKYATGSPVGSDCGDHICVHWVEDGSRQSVHDDGNVGTIPAWVDTTRRVMEHVYGVEVGTLGYRAPLADTTSSDSGGDGRLDVYLADIGVDALYGYCTSDDPHLSSSRAVSAYCVLDNDYKTQQFPYHTPEQNLDVTAAHEFFHAVQYAYNWAQDEWLLEGTAAWMEDQVYDSINDNRQYLPVSPLKRPWHSLDAGYEDPFSGYFPPYGSWIFWRYLSESFGPGSSDDPGIVKSVWERATTTSSALALRRTLGARHTSFARVFARFGAWTRNPSRYFSEGSHYGASPLSHATFTLSRAHRSTGARTTHIDHMARRFFRFTPGSSLTGGWRVRISVDMANTSRGSLAQAIVHGRSGSLSIVTIRLDKRGRGSHVIGFRRSSVAAVDLDLINDSTRYYCNQGTDLSCGGLPRDDGLRATFTAAAVR
jgi:hypothetical protein